MTDSSMGPWVRVMLVAGLALVLAACAPREQRPEGAWMAEREALFEAYNAWSVSGRVSLSDGERGGQLAFDWRTDGDWHEVRLRTVMGGRQWRLRFAPGEARLVGSEVGELTGAHPDPLVEQAVGWPIPVADLAWWIRGLAPPHANGEMRFDDDGTLASARRAPWTLDFQRFEQGEHALLPTRLQADSPPYRVRLVLRNWSLGSQ